jgi:hypothetical protein
MPPDPDVAPPADVPPDAVPPAAVPPGELPPDSSSPPDCFDSPQASAKKTKKPQSSAFLTIPEL